MKIGDAIKTARRIVQQWQTECEDAGITMLPYLLPWVAKQRLIAAIAKAIVVESLRGRPNTDRSAETSSR
jgi:hypothetical protein